MNNIYIIREALRDNQIISLCNENSSSRVETKKAGPFWPDWDLHQLEASDTWVKLVMPVDKSEADITV